MTDVKCPRLELRQIYAFVAVAEELHFGRAAARIHMAQSPLSRVVKKLESDIGVELFVRTKRRVQLTPAGAALLEDARVLLTVADEIVDRASANAEGRETGFVRPDRSQSRRDAQSPKIALRTADSYRGVKSG